jgi:hypothetical protein
MEVVRHNFHATVTHRIVLEDERIVYAHYGTGSFGSSPDVWTLEVVSVSEHETQVQNFDLSPVDPEKDPAILPGWLAKILASVPINVPAMTQIENKPVQLTMEFPA